MNLFVWALISANLTSWLLLSLTFLKNQSSVWNSNNGSALTPPPYPRWGEWDPSSYSYTQYRIDFPGKILDSPGVYQRRKSLFEEHLMHIDEFNLKAATTYNLGINDFLDRFPEELPQSGYDKSQHVAWKEWHSTAMAVDSAKAGSISTEASKFRMDYWTFMGDKSSTKSLDDLPKHVDWRIDSNTGKSLATPVKSQGQCGSCWAFASTAALESHLAMSLLPEQTLLSLSVQELVSCVPNPNQCGGTGGCGGSTAELAYNFIASHGLVDEWTFGYQNYDNQQRVACSLKQEHPLVDGENPTAYKYFDRAQVTVEGVLNLPSNNYTALMHAVATFGPIVVNVAADNWHFYESGVFTDHGHSVARTDINHVVVLMGYGTDEHTGEAYWLVRNSYGPFWGEGGYIRLKRTDPTTLPHPDADCGMDVRPADGIACTQKDGKDTKPPAVKVCGTSGVLFDPVLPIGVRLLKQTKQT